MTETPSLSDEIWKKVLIGETVVDFEFLAVKLLLSRLQLKLRRDPSQLEQLKGEFRNIFVQKAHLPATQKDLSKLTGEK